MSEALCPDTHSVQKPYFHTIGFQLIAARNRNEAEEEKRWKREKKRDVDQVTRRTMKRFTVWPTLPGDLCVNLCVCVAARCVKQTSMRRPLIGFSLCAG